MPQVKQVIDTKPGLTKVLDIKPGLEQNFEESVTHYDDKIILKGQPMGMLLTLTYPSQLNYTIERP